MKKNNETNRKPFFAAFLESQVERDETRRVQGGDSDPVLDQPQTNKYPSDQEDDNTTKPSWDCILTAKYPSDNDESEDM